MSSLLKSIAAALVAGGGTVIEREIDVRGQKIKVHLREPSGNEMEAVYAEVRGADGNVAADRNRELRNRIMAVTVCNADGSLAMTYDQAGELPTSVHTQLQALVLKVNGLEAQGEARKNG